MTGPEAATTFDVATGVGPARVHLRLPDGSPPGLLLLGHGAGGGLSAPDLAAAASAAGGLGWAVALVEQPWLVAGRRIATPPPTLDVAWRAVAPAVAERLGGAAEPVVVHGGRSAGARVACRTGAGLKARAVLCLAFPLHPPGRPERSRAPELAGAGVPALVVQGRRDPFGSPEEVAAAAPAATVVPVDGDHSLGRARGSAAAVRDAVAGWLAVLPPAS